MSVHPFHSCRPGMGAGLAALLLAAASLLGRAGQPAPPKPDPPQDLKPFAVFPFPPPADGVPEPRPLPATLLVFAPDGKTLAAGYFARDVVLWNVAARQPWARIRGWNGNQRSVAFSPDGRSLAVALWDGPVRLSDPVTGRLQGTWTPEDAARRVGSVGLAFSRDGEVLVHVVGSAIRVWDFAAGQVQKTIAVRWGTVTALAVSPDAKYLAVAFWGDLVLWDLEAGAERLPHLKCPVGQILTMAFTPDGKTLLAAGDEGMVRTWDVETGREKGGLRGHSGAIASVALSPDGALAATGGRDGTLRVWDLAARELRATLPNPNPDAALVPVEAVAFSPDGKTLASSGSGSHSIKLWNVARVLEHKPAPPEEGK